MQTETTTPSPPTVTRTLPFLKSLQDAKEAAAASGHHFFDPDTMRHFGSKLAGDFYPLAGGMAGLFITSEQDRSGFMGRQAWNGARLYTVRLASFGPVTYGLTIDDAGPYPEGFAEPNGRPVGTDHGFGAFRTLAAARKYAKACATPGTPEREALYRAALYRCTVNKWPGPYFTPATPASPALEA